jgi:hypothetical protein
VNKMSYASFSLLTDVTNHSDIDVLYDVGAGDGRFLVVNIYFFHTAVLISFESLDTMRFDLSRSALCGHRN